MPHREGPASILRCADAFARNCNGGQRTGRGARNAPARRGGARLLRGARRRPRRSRELPRAAEGASRAGTRAGGRSLLGDPAAGARSPRRGRGSERDCAGGRGVRRRGGGGREGGGGVGVAVGGGGQIATDLLDIQAGGTSQDLLNGKHTLPVVHALTTVAGQERKRLRKLLSDARESPDRHDA